MSDLDDMEARVEALEERVAIQYVEALEEAAAELRRAAGDVECQDECEAEAFRSAARIVRALIERERLRHERARARGPR